MPCYQVDRKRKGSKEGRYNNKGYNEKGYKNNGGEGGIRTLDTLLTYTHFPGVRFRPLSHFTVLKAYSIPKGKANVIFAERI